MSAAAEHEPADRDQLRDLLEARRRRLTHAVQLRVARMREQAATVVPVDGLVDGDESDLDMRVVEMLSTTVQDIDRALERLHRGEYGRCVECHGEISGARLRAMPFAVRCRDCETAREREITAHKDVVRTTLWREEQRTGEG
jgi:DnaK suppressor protein